MNFPPAVLAWSVWGLGALLYLIGFYQRVAPAVITDRLMTFGPGGGTIDSSGSGAGEIAARHSPEHE